MASAAPFTTAELLDAWERVDDNDGCAGVDAVSIERYAARLADNIEDLRKRLATGAYRPLPLRKILVEKAPGSVKTRRLLVPAVSDRLLQTAAARRLSRSFEEEFLDSSYAYRPHRSVDRAIARVTQLRDRGLEWIVDADIEGYFDNVDHSTLLQLLDQNTAAPELMPLVEMWIKAEFWDGKRVRKLDRGIAQGSPLSPLLANYFLGDFDAQLEQSDCYLVRYADDFLILCHTREAAERMKGMAAEWLHSRKLKLNEAKTRITHFAEGFQFLGVFFLRDEVYVPWKGDRPKGRLLFTAPPMPLALITRYLLPPPVNEMTQALRQAGVRRVQPATVSSRRKPVAFLYVTEQGSVLRKSGERFLIERDDRILLDLPYHKLEAVLLFGNIQLTTQAMAELLEKSVPVSLFSSQGRFRGSLTPPHGGDVRLRLAQFEMYRDPAVALKLARALTAAKVANGISVLERYRERGSAPGGPMEDELALMKRMHGEMAGAAGLEELGGMEGTSARAYFTALMRFNLSGLKWDGRQKRPAPDPINALLSLSYTLVMHELTGLVEGLGLDPFLGFMHQPEYGRPSLALDLLEPFRHPVADRLVLTLLNRGVLKAPDFAPPVKTGDGVFLTQDGMRRFLESYERWMLARPRANPEDKESPGRPSFRQLLRRDVERFVGHLKGGQEYQPFVLKDLENWEEEEWNTSSVTI